MARIYEFYLRVEKYFTSDRSEKVNFISSNQRVIFFYYIDMSVSKIKKKKKTKNKNKSKRITSAISSLVRIWKYLPRNSVVFSSVQYALSILR